MSQPVAQDQIEPLPQAQQPQTQPRVGPTPPTPTVPTTVPTTAPAQPQSQPPPTAATLNPTQATNEVPPSFTRRLDAGEELWVWKLGLRVSCVVLAIIGIGCMGWAVATSPPYGPYTYELSDQLTLSWTLITFGVSAIWCSICILVLLIRKRPCHPGVAVGMDLLLWLAFIPTAMLALMGVISIARFGIDGEIGRYSSYGSYELAINGTWIWNATEYDTYFQNSRDCSLDGSYTKQYNDYGFDSCEEEDAYVNALWAAKPNRMRVEITGTVCQFLGFFLHFALFVWACVDTHRRNRRKVSRDAERLAGDIVMKMVRSGAVIPPQNQPAGPYQQIPDAYQRGAPYGGGWPIPGPAPMARGPPQQMMPMARGPPQQMMPPPPQWLNPPMPEKGDSARFA